MRSDLLAALLGTAIVCTTPAVASSPTSFTYQGQLAQDGVPAEGAFEFEIRLLDNLGVQIGMTQIASEVVIAGSLTIELDFGNGAFGGNARYLEISVRSVVDGGNYVVLTPNQLVTSTPVAQFALSGNEGPQGPVGSQGNPGIQGDPGTPGVDGADGGQGPQGDQGNAGADGATGAQGNPGVPGTPGDSHWTLSGSDTYYNTGNVGFGTSNPNFPVHAQGTGFQAVFGYNTAPSGFKNGMLGQSDSSNGRGVFGFASASTGATSGVRGETASSDGRGVYGIATAITGTTYGVYGQSASDSGRGLYGEATATSGTTYGVYGKSEGFNGRGLFGFVSSLSGPAYGVYGQSVSSSGRGVYGYANANTGTNYGVYGKTRSSSGYAGYFEGGRNYFQGNVGIGVISPIANLHISSSGEADFLRIQKTGVTKMLVNANGGVSLGTYNPSVPDGDTLVAGNLTVGTSVFSTTFDLNVSGTAGKTGGGSWAVFSDARLKKNITSMTGSLDTISALRPVNFEYTAKDHFSYTPGVQSGFIAQEVQQVIPQWVNTADDGYFYLDQVGYEALIVDAIQELRAEKDAVQDEVNDLRLENELLKARLDRLERLMTLSVGS